MRKIGKICQLETIFDDKTKTKTIQGNYKTKRNQKRNNSAKNGKTQRIRKSNSPRKTIALLWTCNYRIQPEMEWAMVARWYQKYIALRVGCYSICTLSVQLAKECTLRVFQRKSMFESCRCDFLPAGPSVRLEKCMSSAPSERHHKIYRLAYWYPGFITHKKGKHISHSHFSYVYIPAQMRENHVKWITKKTPPPYSVWGSRPSGFLANYFHVDWINMWFQCLEHEMITEIGFRKAPLNVETNAWWMSGRRVSVRVESHCKCAKRREQVADNPARQLFNHNANGGINFEHVMIIHSQSGFFVIRRKHPPFARSFHCKTHSRIWDSSILFSNSLIFRK